MELQTITQHHGAFTPYPWLHAMRHVTSFKAFIEVAGVLEVEWRV